MSHRSTFSLAQLLLLVMLTGMLCVWLPKMEQCAREQSVRGTGPPTIKLSDDGSRLLKHDINGFSVFDTASGKCLRDKRIVSIGHPVFDTQIRTVCIEKWDVNDGSVSSLSNLPWVICDADTSFEREIVAPNLSDGVVRRPLAIDNDGRFVEVIHPSNGASNHIRRWNLQTGALSSDVESEVSGYLHLLRDNGTVACSVRDEKLLIQWTLPSGELVQSKYPIFEAEVRNLMGMSRSQDKVVFFMRENFGWIPAPGSETIPPGANAPGSPGMPGPAILRPAQRYLVIADNSGQVRLLQVPDFDYVGPGALTADGRYLLSFGRSAREYKKTLFFRMDLETGAYQVLDKFKEDYSDPTREDFELINHDQQVALAMSDATFRLLDANTGQEIRRVHCARHSLGFAFWLTLGGSGVAWTIMWWLATRRKKGESFEIGRFLLFAVFFVALLHGFFVLAYFDPWGNTVHPSFLIPTAIAFLVALAGLVLLFSRFCNRLLAAYTLFSSAGITAHALWLWSQCPT